MKKAPPGTTIIIGSASVATLIVLIAAWLAWNLEHEASLVVATIALVWATLILGLATLFLALVALNEIAQNREDSARALEAAQRQHEAAIEAGRQQTEAAIEAAREQSQDDRNHTALATLRANQTARQELDRQLDAARQQNEELIRASHRPLLVPAERFEFLIEDFQGFSGIGITFSNVGSGVATNIQVLVVPHSKWFSSLQFFGRSPLPVAASRTGDVALRKGNLILHYDGHKIKGALLYAPEHARGGRGNECDPMFRLTFTYEDSFDVKHVSMYDWLRNGTWDCVLIDKNLRHHIDELDRQSTPTPPPVTPPADAAPGSGPAPPNA